MKYKRYDVAVSVFNNMVFILGGGPNYNNPGKEVYVYDVNTNQILRRGDMLYGRCRFGAATLGLQICVCGGVNAGNRTECLTNAYANSWVQKADMIEYRYDHAVTEHDGHMYAIGGYNRRSCERFDMILNKWFPVASLSVKRSQANACSFKGHIYLVGGLSYDDNGVMVERYSAVTDQWERMRDLGVQVYMGGAVIWSDQLVVLGSSYHSGASGRRSKFQVYDEDLDEWQYQFHYHLHYNRVGVVSV